MANEQCNSGDGADPHVANMLATFAAHREQRRQYQAEGIPALQRLLKVAQGFSGQSKVCASFLLSCYNGNRFKFDLTDFRALDADLFADCLAVLRMDSQPAREVHCYFENGGEIFEKLAKDWGIRDYTKRAR